MSKPTAAVNDLTTASVAADDKPGKVAKEVIRLYGDKIPAAAQENILLQRVTLGMSPKEARLAAGAAFYKVQSDPKVWGDSNPNPLVVMDRQSVAPDDSKIWMTFETETQFPGEGKSRFQVYFERGKAISITKSE